MRKLQAVITILAVLFCVNSVWAASDGRGTTVNSTFCSTVDPGTNEQTCCYELTSVTTGTSKTFNITLPKANCRITEMSVSSQFSPDLNVYLASTTENVNYIITSTWCKIKFETIDTNGHSDIFSPSVPFANKERESKARVFVVNDSATVSGTIKLMLTMILR